MDKNINIIYKSEEKVINMTINNFFAYINQDK